MNKNHAALLLLTTAVVKFFRDGVLPALPLLVSLIGMTEGQAELMVTLFLLGNLVSRLFWPIISDRFGPRNTILLMMTVALIATLMPWLQLAVWSLLAARLGQGFAVGALAPIIRAGIHRQAGSKQTLKLLAYIGALAIWASPLATAAAALVLAHSSLHNFLLMTAVVALIVLSLYFSLIPAAEVNITRNWLKSLASMRQVFTQPSAIHICLIYGMTSAGIYGFITMAPLYLVKDHHWSLLNFSWAIFAVTTGQQLGKLWAGRLANHASITDILQRLSWLVAIAAIGAWSTRYLPFAGIGLVVWMSLYYFSYGLCVPSTKTAVMDVCPEHAASASALLGFVGSIAAVAASLLMAACTEHGLLVFQLMLSLIALTSGWLCRQLTV